MGMDQGLTYQGWAQVYPAQTVRWDQMVPYQEDPIVDLIPLVHHREWLRVLVHHPDRIA